MLFQSWEFIAIANLLLVLFLPWIASRAPLIAAFSFLPLVLACLEWSFGDRVDLAYFLMICILHWNISFVNLLLLFYASQGHKLWYFGIVSASALLSLSLFFSTPALTVVDPFWGVLPGVILADPIIPLYPYLLRLGASGIAWVLLALLWLYPLRQYAQFVSYWLCLFVVGFFLPTPFLSSSLLREQFEAKAESNNIQLYVQNKEVYEFSPGVMAEELQFFLNQLIERLPESSKPNLEEKLEIYLYANDDEKAYWIGARGTQIGNFYQSQMHLSHFDLTSDFLPHEIAHLIHGRLDAPIASYTDPLVFEGFAVALSAANLERPLRRAAAIYQQMPQAPTTWPHFLDFAAYARPISYRLGGAFSAFYLKENKLPWVLQKTSPSIVKLKDLEIDAAEKKEAAALLQLKPLHKNPSARDCARHRHMFLKDRFYRKWKQIHQYCHRDFLSLREAYRLPDLLHKKMAFKQIASLEARADLAMLENEFGEAISLYSQCTDEECDLKSSMLESEVGRAKLQQFLMSSEPDEHLYAHNWQKPGIQEKRIRKTDSLVKRAELYKRLQSLRELNNKERLQAAKTHFFAALYRSQEAATNEARAIQKKWSNSPPPDAEAFLQRLRYQVP